MRFIKDLFGWLFAIAAMAFLFAIIGFTLGLGWGVFYKAFTYGLTFL